MNENSLATRRTRILSVMLVAVAAFFVDQLSKYWLVRVFDMPHRTPLVLNEYFALVMAWNKGVSFSMFANSADWMPHVLTMAAVVVSAILLRLGMKTTHRIERIGYALVAGGALGNACDRARFGAVADFFYAHVGTLGWPAFNVADMAICTGVALLLFSMVKQPARP